MAAPAEPGEGIAFVREGQRTKATWENVSATRLATVLGEGEGGVRTVEHLMSTFAALGIADALVSLDGPEVPIMDGSAAPFFEALRPAVEDAPSRGAICVTRPVVVRKGNAFAALLPHSTRSYDIGIDFPDAAIGAQRAVFDLDTGDFGRDIAPARTFGLLKDVKRMRRAGYGKGASLENAIAVDGPRVLNDGGLRFDNEFARHKLLDAIGDLALAGRPILGRYRAHKGGHTLNFRLLAALMGNQENFAIYRE